jgi:hypothetical protein
MLVLRRGGGDVAHEPSESSAWPLPVRATMTSRVVFPIEGVVVVFVCALLEFLWGSVLLHPSWLLGPFGGVLALVSGGFLLLGWSVFRWY